MDCFLPFLVVVLLAAVGLLWFKVRLLQRCARQIGQAFQDRLATDTNTLIDLPSRDPHMRRLASDINAQLRLLRSQRQRYQRGDRQVKEAVSIPVIGNGDVTSPQKADELVRQTGCDGIMIARGAQGNPWIFSEMIHWEETGELPPRPDKDEIRKMMLRHARLQLEYKGEFCGIREMRKHVAWYTKGLKGAARMREKVNAVESLEELENLLTSL